MGVTATFMVLADAISKAQTFVNVFVSVYSLLILLYIVASWLRLPYSPWLNRVQRFLYDVCNPYLRLFRRVLPPLGPLDLSPVLAVIVLFAIQRGLDALLARAH